MALLLKQCKLITSCFCSPVNQINTGASSDYCLHNGCLGDDPQLSLSMDREVWRGERGGLYLYFTPSVHKKSPQSVSIKHWNSIHSSVPALPPLTWSVLHRLRLLSELTILTWKKISNKDICDPIRQLGPHSPGAPPGIYCYGNDVICKLTSSSAWGDFSNDIIDQESFSRLHSFEFLTFYGLPVVSVHMKDLKQHDTARKGQPKYVKVFLNASPN